MRFSSIRSPAAQLYVTTALEAQDREHLHTKVSVSFRPTRTTCPTTYAEVSDRAATTRCMSCAGDFQTGIPTPADPQFGHGGQLRGGSQEQLWQPPSLASSVYYISGTTSADRRSTGVPSHLSPIWARPREGSGRAGRHRHHQRFDDGPTAGYTDAATPGLKTSPDPTLCRLISGDALWAWVVSRVTPLPDRSLEYPSRLRQIFVRARRLRIRGAPNGQPQPGSEGASTTDNYAAVTSFLTCAGRSARNGPHRCRQFDRHASGHELRLDD
jgi:hypothetical protein